MVSVQKNKEIEKQLADKTREIQVLQQQLKEITEKYEKEMSKQKEEFSKIQMISAIKQQPVQAIEILNSRKVQELEKIEQIGSGNGGKVTKVSKKNIYVLKEMNIQNANSENFQNFIKEYEAISMHNHTSIVKTYDIYMNDKKTSPSILLEYCPSNLEQAIKNKTLNKVQLSFIIYQIAEGMKYIHSRRIIHRNLKPSNILIAEDGMIKICDFGISDLMSVEEQILTRGVGIQKYMAPEVINEEKYNEKVDVYSFGSVVFFILNEGELPDIKMREACLGQHASIPEKFSLLARQLIDACWSFNQEERPGFSIICNILEQNNFNLTDLTSSQIEDLSAMINEYRKHIPEYNE